MTVVVDNWMADCDPIFAKPEFLRKPLHFPTPHEYMNAVCKVNVDKPSIAVRIFAVDNA